MHKLIITIFLSIFILKVQNAEVASCQYTCLTCSGDQYYHCLTCQENRGQQKTFTPIAGMCYCTEQTDESSKGVCEDNNQYNYNNKALIAAFIGLSLLFSLIATILTGFRHYLIKTIEDVQQISLIVFINLYFPQQFDIFLTKLYRFNISSFSFENLAKGSLYQFASDGTIYSTDGQNILGKYQLLYKTANFFANTFTWLIVFVVLLVVAIVIRVVRGWMKKGQDQEIKRRNARKMKKRQEETLANLNENRNQSEVLDNEFSQGDNQKNKKNHPNLNPNDNAIMDNQSKASQQKQQQQEQTCKQKAYRFINSLTNMIWFSFFIIFFYLSLIEININIFTQIGNLTFSSSFAAFGAFFSALFLAAEFVILGLLWIKTKEESSKPEWMRDYSYTATIYLVRTNYKTVTKYFWFFACFKKILIALAITTLYEEPKKAIMAVSIVSAIFICFSIYCEPFERRYLRLHFYTMEIMKVFLFLSLINFTEKYLSYVRMIEMTKILYTVLALIFGFNFFFIFFNMLVERHWYIRAFRRKFCSGSGSAQKQQNGNENGNFKGNCSSDKLGYHSQGKLYLFERE